ncbi:PTS sugar transporter subunit IIA [Pectinatus haikarae]|uniref:Fructose-specific phosphotransferase system IIA component n=1 Tax=Pectinatus haikarae TaxID=349096 RepID=A0ABT9YBM7_9FIRM|nr:PTS sugar transporter subunit IIA [Pectinatus haikarae]MDQ0204627.1 fructose-specific phosphotransferase system IIA component [Pectinatus haikarae]
MDITAVIKKDNIIFNLEGKNKTDAITQLAQCLLKNRVITDLNGFVADVLKREEEFSTGIGFGLAIPHAKSVYVTKTAVAVGKLNTAIGYNTADNEKVKLLFLIAVPEKGGNEHLNILSQLSRKFMDESFRHRLDLARNSEEIIRCLMDN